MELNQQVEEYIILIFTREDLVELDWEVKQN